MITNNINNKLASVSNSTPKVSVIMNCLNCSEYLREAIESVYVQTYSNWEIVFWDNASTDSSAEIARSYDDRLLYFKGDQTVPLGQARNLAIKKANGAYISFLDCDDIWLPKKLEKQMSLFAKNPELGLVYSNCLQVYLPTNHQEELFSKVKAYRGDVLEKLFMGNFIPMLTVVTKRDILVNSGAFYDKLKISLDYDMWLRIAEKAPVDYVEEVLAIYRIHDKSFTLTNPTLSPLDDIIVINRCLERNPKLRITLGKKVSKMISKRYISLAFIYLKQNMIRNSFDMLLKSFKLYPMYLPSFLYSAFNYYIRRLF